MSNNSTDGIEERTPASEYVRDSSPQGKDSRRVSWNVAENDDFAPSGHKHISDPSDERVAELPFVASSVKSLILQPKPTPSTIETEELKTNNQVGDCQPSIERALTSEIPKDITSKPEGCSKNMDRNILYFPNSNQGSMKAMPLVVEEPSAIQRNLLQKVSRLKRAVLSIQKRDSAQRGKSLVREYQLRAELEALCEDVIFLGEKRNRLSETLRELRVKNAEIHKSESISDGSSDGNIVNNSDHIMNSNNNEDKAEEQEGTGVSDASVQTEDFPPTVVDRPLTLNPGFEIAPRPIVSAPI